MTPDPSDAQPDYTGALTAWPMKEAKTAQPVRNAEWWWRQDNSDVACSLCYRNCNIAPGELGWCRYRGNNDGTMAIPAHGVVTSAVRQMLGYQANFFHTYKPGAPTLFLGTVNCTSNCSFCISGNLVWRSEEVPWGPNGQMGVGMAGGWYGYRNVLHPQGAVQLAKDWGCTGIEFGVTEPTLSWEYTYDVAVLAQQAGLDVTIETNGYTSRPAVRKLAPFINGVGIGIKGSGDEGFYSRQMRSAGAMDAIREAAVEWKRSGAHLIIRDVLAPRHLQDPNTAEEAQRRLYGWIVETLGPLTHVDISGMRKPTEENGTTDLMLGRSGTETEVVERIERATELARSMGLLYVKPCLDGLTVNCHACHKPLVSFAMRCADGWAEAEPTSPRLAELRKRNEMCVMSQSFCPWQTHTQYVTDSRCDHCGVAVPLVTLSAEALANARALVQQTTTEYGISSGHTAGRASWASATQAAGLGRLSSLSEAFASRGPSSS